MKRTALYKLHQKHGAKLVPFAGWDMPIHYGSQIEEHHAVRRRVGMFDVSHMCVMDVSGEDTEKFLRYVFANDVQKLKIVGKALYTCMLNTAGGVVDDLIVYRLGDSQFRLVLNASRADEDVAWLTALSKEHSVQLNKRDDLSMLAVQGPKALQLIDQIFSCEASQLSPFSSLFLNHLHIARTGYTGEDGVEIIVPNDEISGIWEQLIEKGVHPCGLGARDTLRLEAGLNLFGQDMDETTSPLVSHLAWTISWNDESREFVGKKALLKQKSDGVLQKLVGIKMEERGVLRNHQKIFSDGHEVGEITSGSYSPTLECAIGLARVSVNVSDPIFVERRGKQIPVKIVKLPFVRKVSTT